MDPASFSFAVIGMFLTCCKGYAILSDVHRAPKDARDVARRFRIQSAILMSWGEHFDIRPGMQRQQRHGEEKLSVHLLKQETSRGVFESLCAISDIFVDTKSLDSKYGLVLHDLSEGDMSSGVMRDIQDVLDGPERSRSPYPKGADKADASMQRKLRHNKDKMSLLQRCSWSLRGKSKIQELLNDLQYYNESLYYLCRWEDRAQINRALPCLVVPLSSNFTELHLMAKLAEEAAKDKTSPVAEGRERIAEMARFKAELIKDPDKYQPRWRLLDQRDYRLYSASSLYSFGESLQTQDTVYVEWQSYRGQNNKPDKAVERQIHRLGDLLTIPDRPYDLRVLDCIGLFKDHANDRYGVVYNLPEHLRSLSKGTPTDNRGIYNPSTLTQLMYKVEGVLELGHRFNLARKLVQSIVVMHTCGWLHKNIRSDNIFFFAARPAPGEPVKDHLKDVGRPIIVGYGLSRPDDIADGFEKREPTRGYSYNETSRRGKQGDNNGHDAEKPNFDIYQHPDKLADPDLRFRHSYDIYSLGLVLLEIGLWKDLYSSLPSRCESAYDFKTYVLERLVPDLWGQCGAIYGGVVKDCLTMDSDLELADEGQRRLAFAISERLDKCVA